MEMFTHLCALTAELMPGSKRTQIGSKMVEYRRPDKQFVLIGMNFAIERKPVVIASVLEATAIRLGLSAGSTSLSVDGTALRVRVTHFGLKVMISFEVDDLGACEDALRLIVGAM